jgi:hypothetical protein
VRRHLPGHPGGGGGGWPEGGARSPSFSPPAAFDRSAELAKRARVTGGRGWPPGTPRDSGRDEKKLVRAAQCEDVGGRAGGVAEAETAVGRAVAAVGGLPVSRCPCVCAGQGGVQAQQGQGETSARWRRGVSHDRWAHRKIEAHMDILTGVGC